MMTFKTPRAVIVVDFEFTARPVSGRCRFAAGR